MKATYTRYNARDFIQRYVDTYGWLLRDDGTRKFVHITQAEEGRLYYETDGSAEFYALRDRGQIFEFIPVNKGWFNGTDGPVFLSRVPARQWKRGISGSNTEIQKFTDGVLINYILNYTELSKVFNDDFNVKNYPDTFKPGALSKHFCLVNNNLWFYDTVIGILEGTTFKLSNDIVAQELKDLIKRKGWQLHVENHS